MLFNSHIFIFFFLPVAFMSYWWIKTAGGSLPARRWALFITFVFFAWWHPPDLLVLIGSLVANYFVGRRLLNYPPRQAYGTLFIGVAANLAVLGYFKYTRLVVATAQWLSGGEFIPGDIILPLGISFFTFQQIAYIIDCYRGEASRYAFLDYCLFVTFFPHLNAGPIIHHRELMEEFTSGRRLSASMVAMGLTIFVIGLAKKVLLADTLATFASPVFRAAQHDVEPTLIDAWMGSLAYASQLYFDFSGYSDMAIGVGLLFGVHLPINFASPYKSTSITEFWRRWHITLSRFLRNYLYIPLGGNRIGSIRTSANLLVTMLLGGLWHGANWTFLAWGGLHGLFLLVHHRFTDTVKGRQPEAWLKRGVGRILCWLLTFACVLFSWVLFRADSFGAALRIWKGMAGFNGVAFTPRYLALLDQFRIDPAIFGHPASPPILNPTSSALAWVFGSVALAVFAPNSQQIVGFSPTNQAPQDPMPGWARWLRWQPTLLWALAFSLLGLIALAHVTQLSEFLYFQF
ncbi:MAG TPA: MBOAT family O-acyltransferase [Chthoniobacterales bacterium]